MKDAKLLRFESAILKDCFIKGEITETGQAIVDSESMKAASLAVSEITKEFAMKLQDDIINRYEKHTSRVEIAIGRLIIINVLGFVLLTFFALI